MVCTPEDKRDEFPTSKTANAIELLSSGNAIGPDAISAEIFKARGRTMENELTDHLFHTV